MNFIEVEKDKALINCIWQNMRDKIWILMKAADTLCKAWINVEIVSQWYLQRAITFWIKQEKYNEAIKCLHKNLIEN